MFPQYANEYNNLKVSRKPLSYVPHASKGSQQCLCKIEEKLRVCVCVCVCVCIYIYIYYIYVYVDYYV